MRVKGKGLFPEATCVGKKAFLTYDAAKRNGLHSESMRKAKVTIYKCPHCRQFHIGAHGAERNVKREIQRIRERECME